MPASSCALPKIVGFGGGEQRPWLGQEQVVVPLDGHDVGVLGDRPERPVRRIVDPRDGVVRPQMGQRRVQPCVVGIGRRIGQNLRGVIHRRRAHTGSFIPRAGQNLTGVKFRVYVTEATPGQGMRETAVSRLGPRAARIASPRGRAVAGAAGGGGAAGGRAAAARPDAVERPRRSRRWRRPSAGAVRGTVAADHRCFAGIPYAAPPIGSLRWQPPAPAPPGPDFATPLAQARGAFRTPATTSTGARPAKTV